MNINKYNWSCTSREGPQLVASNQAVSMDHGPHPQGTPSPAHPITTKRLENTQHGGCRLPSSGGQEQALPRYKELQLIMAVILPQHPVLTSRQGSGRTRGWWSYALSDVFEGNKFICNMYIYVCVCVLGTNYRVLHIHLSTNICLKYTICLGL